MTKWEKLTKRTYKKQPTRFKTVRQIVGRANKIKIERDDIAHGNFTSAGKFFKMRDGSVVDISDDVGKPPYLEDLACRISDINVLVIQHQNALRRHFRRGRSKSRKPYSLP